MLMSMIVLPMYTSPNKVQATYRTSADPLFHPGSGFQVVLEGTVQTRLPPRTMIME
jgi:hypothetical protein